MKILKDVLTIIVIIGISVVLVLWTLNEFGVKIQPSTLDEAFYTPKTLTQSSEYGQNTPNTQIGDLHPSTPLRITIPSIDIIDQPIKQFSNDELDVKGRIRPADPNDIVWWTGGGCPGATKSNGSEALTTYIFGHSSNNPDRKVIFDDIDELKAGDEIIIDTGKYKFTYSVSQVFVVSKNEFSTNPIVTANQEGRLLLVSCWSSSANYGGSTVNNVVVKAMLDSVELEIETPPTPPSA